MASHWLQARQTKYVGYITTYILVVLAALVVPDLVPGNGKQPTAETVPGAVPPEGLDPLLRTAWGEVYGDGRGQHGLPT